MNEERFKKAKVARRGFIRRLAGGIGLFAFGGLLGKLAARVGRDRYVWQIDPTKCIYCDKCATACVLTPSAVKCVHDFTMCGYCRICVGFFVTEPPKLDEGAENQLCPVGALRRKFVEEPYYEYKIDEDLCYGCARCVKGCSSFGNGSLYLQIKRDLCLNCNECAIERACKPKAIVRIPAEQQYITKKHA
ncbi:MAG: ferredoxin [Planctomycetota bacterium]